MEYKETGISGLWIIEPKVLTDSRGYFMEAFKQEVFERHVGKVNFIQEMNRVLPVVFYVGCIISWLLTRRLNWCG